MAELERISTTHVGNATQGPRGFQSHQWHAALPMQFAERGKARVACHCRPWPSVLVWEGPSSRHPGNPPLVPGRMSRWRPSACLAFTVSPATSIEKALGHGAGTPYGKGERGLNTTRSVGTVPGAPSITSSVTGPRRCGGASQPTLPARRRGRGTDCGVVSTALICLNFVKEVCQTGTMARHSTQNGPKRCDDHSPFRSVVRKKTDFHVP